MLTRPLAIACSFLAAVTACRNPDANGVRRARLEQSEARADQAVRRVANEVVATELEIDERRAELERAQASLDQIRDRQQGLIDEVTAALQTVAILERDLTAARERQRQIEAELAPIRALERRLAEIEAEIAELETRRTERSAELATLAAQEADLAASLAARRNEVEQRGRAVLAEIERIREISTTLDAAIELLAPQVPPAPPESGTGQPASDAGQRTRDSK